MEFEGKESGSTIDLSEYDGKKAKIAGYELKEVNSMWGAGGEKLTEPRRVQRLRVYTEEITTIPREDEDDISVVASELFAVDDASTDEKVIYSKHEKAALNKFLQLMKVETPDELIGKQVLILLRDPFLGFRKE